MTGEPDTRQRVGPRLAVGVMLGILLAGASAMAAAPSTVTRSKSVKAKTFAAVKAPCPHGTRPAFGGFTADFSRTGGALPIGISAAGRAWRFGAGNNSNAVRSISSIAYCSAHPSYIVRSGSKPVPASRVTTATATCPGGSQLLAGGYRGKIDVTDSQPLSLVTAMRRTGARSLAVTAAGVKGAGSVTALAYCGDGPRPSAHGASADVLGDAIGTARARCPHHSSLVFGGFKASAKLTGSGTKLVAPGALSRNGRGWKAVGVNATKETPGKITAIAYCS